jgi:6-phosphogluconolactonase
VTGGNAVSVWEIDDVGALTEVQSLDQGTGLGPLAQWNSQFMYAARVDEQAVAALSIDPVSGALTELGVTGVAHRPVYMSVDPSGGWLLSADFGLDLVQINPINADGTVDGTPSQSSTVQSRPHAILFDPGGQYVFVPHRDSNLVEQYVFDEINGTLTPNDPPSVALPDGAGARHLAFAPDATRAYVVNEFSSSVTAFTYDAANGLLTQGVTVSALPPDFKGDNTGADIHVSSDGAYVYASMRGDDSIAVFAAGADGSLTYQANVPTEARPREFGLDPFGNFLYAAGQDTGMLASYTIEADGNLTPGPVYPVGANPLWVLGVELPAR